MFNVFSNQSTNVVNSRDHSAQRAMLRIKFHSMKGGCDNAVSSFRHCCEGCAPPLPLTPSNLRLSTATHSSCPRSVVYSFSMYIQPLRVHFMATSCFLQILFSYFLALLDKHSAFITGRRY